MDNEKHWLSLMALSTTYDRAARLVPALASLLPLLPLTLALGGTLEAWLAFFLGTTGAFALGAVVLANVASAMGNRLQQQLWPDWPFDAPTNFRLRPDNLDTSPQQRARWYQQIKGITGLDLQMAADCGDDAAIRATINDAVERLRNHFRRGNSGIRHDQESIRYGTARNLTGMRPMWLSLSVVSCTGCWAAFLWQDVGVLWPIVSSLIPVPLFVLAFRVLPAFVRTRARYYCEVFFHLLDEESA